MYFKHDDSYFGYYNNIQNVLPAVTIYRKTVNTGNKQLRLKVRFYCNFLF